MTEIVQIVPQKIGDGNSQTVSARDLHKFLGVKKDFSDWIKVQIKRGHFRENVNYSTVPLRGESEKVTLYHNGLYRNQQGQVLSIDYFLTIETAKHIAIISETEKGYEVKEYFLKFEQEYCELKIQKAVQEAVERERQNQNPKIAWSKTRVDGVSIRKLFTDTVQKFVAYAKSQGSKNADRYYSLITLEIYRTVGLIKRNKDFGNLKNSLSEVELRFEDLQNLEKQFNFRNELDVENLTVISSCQLIAQRIIETEMLNNEPYKKIYQTTKNKLSTIQIAFEPYIATAKQQLEFKNTLFEFLLLENKQS